MKSIAIIFLVVMSLFKVDVIYTGEPEWLLWGNPQYITFDERAHEWTNDNPSLELVFREMDRINGVTKHTLPERVPEKKRVKVTLNPFWRREDPFDGMQAITVCGVATRRLKLVNVEHTVNELAQGKTQFRVWPHLGVLSVGTVAEQEGWDVALHDELVQGYVDLEKFIEPGDVLGLSLVVTGMERGIELARQAKHLGASCVIAGNDSATFRANQVLGLSDRPIDAIFNSNSLTAVRQFLRHVGSSELQKLDIPGVAVVSSAFNRSNERSVVLAEREMRVQLRKEGAFDPQDVFVVPRLGLLGEEYWQTVWSNYRSVFGHKHINSAEVRNALALFAQGCTRTGQADVCSYCTIADVADIRMPTEEYLKALMEEYQSFGINYFFNVTDSALEMRSVPRMLQKIGAFFPEGLMIYGRAWGLAHHPELIKDWLALTGGRLLINVGMDSGDERILGTGVVKASQAGMRLEENRQAVRNIAASGAHLHYSLIFGSPGETRESCEASIEFFEWTRSVLGTQLDQCETDMYWLNHGSPVSRVFHDYEYAQHLASLAGKEISHEVWRHRFYRHRDTLVVPWECEEAWYDCFTSITVEEAQKYNAYVASAMVQHEGAAPGRGNAFRPG